MKNILAQRIKQFKLLYSIASEQQLAEDDFARESLRESQLVNTSMSHISIWVMLIIGIFYLLFFGDHASSMQIGYWVMICLCGAVFRWSVCERARKVLKNANARQLVLNEQNLLVVNVLLSFLVGSGYWIVGWNGDDRAVQVVALVSTLFAIATVINLSTNLRQFVLCISVNMLQGLIFFLVLDGSIDIVLVVTLLLVWFVLIFLGLRNALWFSESVKMRSLIQQKNQALELSAQALQKALDRSIHNNTSKSHFIAAASHDLRQPLHSMTMLLGILRNSPMSTDQSELVSNISQSAESLRSQFDGLLEISKLEAGAVAVHPRQFDIHNLLLQIVSRFEVDAYNKGLTLSLLGSSLQMQTDPVLVDRILSNLLDNAIKYTDQGEVTIQLRQQDVFAVIEVIDSGMGISEANRNAVFDEYVQINNPARQSSDGVGMGLAVVKRIVELLGGKVTLESDLGKGSVFKLLVPITAKEPVALPSLEKEVVPNSGFIENVKSSEAPDFHQKSVLVVDDDANVLSALDRYITLRNGKPILAATIHEAKKAIDGHDFSLAILDDMIDAESSGLDVANLLKNRISQDKIIIVSGLESGEREREIKVAGYQFYKKPLGIEKMDSVLFRLMMT